MEITKITRDRNNQKLASASGQTAANSLTQAINEARDRGDIELLERIAKDPQAFILKMNQINTTSNQCCIATVKTINYVTDKKCCKEKTAYLYWSS